eukprot:COSAG02_NODE_4143_length_5719_cov_8.765480_1_plen_143_part_10
MLDQPMPVWIDDLYGPGNTEPVNNAGYKTALCDTLCPGFELRDPSNNDGFEQDWARMSPSCETYAGTSRRCFVEDRDWVSGSVAGSGWSVDDDWSANRNTPFARLCPCAKAGPVAYADAGAGICAPVGVRVFEGPEDNGPSYG